MLLHPSPDQLLEAAVHWSNKYKVWDKIIYLIITSFDDVTMTHPTKDKKAFISRVAHGSNKDWTAEFKIELLTLAVF